MGQHGHLLEGLAQVDSGYGEVTMLLLVVLVVVNWWRVDSTFEIAPAEVDVLARGSDGE